MLVDLIPKVLNASNIFDYHLVLIELTAKLNDTHAAYWHSYISRTSQFAADKAYFNFPFQIYVHNNQIIVCKADSDIFKKYGINCGDTITEIDGKKTKQIIEYYLRYVGASNKNYVEYILREYLISKGTNVTIKKGSQIHKIKIELAHTISDDTTTKKTVIKFLNDSTGYFYMCNIKRKDIRNAMNSFVNTKYLILDLRTYPDNDYFAEYLLKRLINNKKNIMYVYEPNMKKPGYLEQGILCKAGSKNKNKKIYQGQIIVLISEESVSSPEYYGMFLKTIPNCIFIGRQTGGCPGGVCERFFLPGEFSVYFTAEKVLFPDSTSALGQGIIPDIYVSPCQCEFGKDEILERALEYIKYKK